jgi:hypothetical protein
MGPVRPPSAGMPAIITGREMPSTRGLVDAVAADPRLGSVGGGMLDACVDILPRRERPCTHPSGSFLPS